MVQGQRPCRDKRLRERERAREREREREMQKGLGFRLF